MATREEVLAAYAANPLATVSPDEAAINFWMQGGLGNFNNIVNEARAQNPTLAKQIDAERVLTGTQLGGENFVGTTSGTTGGANTAAAAAAAAATAAANAKAIADAKAAADAAKYANYQQIVSNAYGSIGRKGFGTGTNQIDQAGYNFWLNALQNGTLTPETFNASFNKSVGQYVNENPTNQLTQYVQSYKPFQNTGLLTQQQMQPQSTGAPAVQGYQSDFAGNFANYMGIPIGAQYNPGVTAGGASPYSQIRAISPQMINPYAGVVANTAMGGYNPMLYENVKAADLAKANAPATFDAPIQYAKGGMVNSLIGPNPTGPDDGMAALDRGEYVVKKSAVDKYGKGLLDMINEGKIPAKKIRSLLD